MGNISPTTLMIVIIIALAIFGGAWVVIALRNLGEARWVRHHDSKRLADPLLPPQAGGIIMSPAAASAAMVKPRRLGLSPPGPFDDSPEDLFWRTWLQQKNGIELAIQHQVGPYTMDFAHLPTRTAILLDAPGRMAVGNKQQKQMERQGWRFVHLKVFEMERNPAQCARAVEAYIRQARR